MSPGQRGFCGFAWACAVHGDGDAWRPMPARARSGSNTHASSTPRQAAGMACGTLPHFWVLLWLLLPSPAATLVAAMPKQKAVMSASS